MTDQPTPINHGWENDAVCPYCGETQQDSWEFDLGNGINGEGTGEIECQICTRKMTVTRHVVIKYSTEKIEGEEDDE